jgi:hypothetical protein
MKRIVIKSQDNHVIGLTVSLQYKNAYTICTSIHNNVAYKITLDYRVKFKFLAIFSGKR